MIHNQVASVLALARTVREGIDDRQIMTSVNSASLRLLLDTLIDLGQPSLHDKFQDQQQRTVAGMLAGFMTEGDKRGSA